METHRSFKPSPAYYEKKTCRELLSCSGSIISHRAGPDADPRYHIVLFIESGGSDGRSRTPWKVMGPCSGRTSSEYQHHYQT